MSQLTPIGRILGVCEHADAYLARNVGNRGLGMWCDGCQRWVTTEKGYDRMWLGKDHPALKGVDVANIPIIGAKIIRRCQGPCGALAQCQLHHTAPRAFFADNADHWPMVWFCTPCHAQWHTLVTPGLCTAYDPTSHATMLIEYLGLERAAMLTRCLLDIGRARRAGAA